MTAQNSGPLALLIDGDNVSPSYIGGVLAEVARYGTASVRRVYGDFSSAYLKGWKDVALTHSLLPKQSYAYTTGKNSTDGALIIDAMDLLHKKIYSGFCIVSSDSDFTGLAARIREDGVPVYGFGRRGTNQAFVKACSDFVYFDVLNKPTGDAEEKLAGAPTERHPAGQPPSRPAQQPDATIPARPQTSSIPGHTHPANPIPALSDNGPDKSPLSRSVIVGLMQAIKSCPSYLHDNSYVNLAQLGLQLSKISPDLNAKNYGYDSLKSFVEAAGIAEVKMQARENGAPIALVRLKAPSEVAREAELRLRKHSRDGPDDGSGEASDVNKRAKQESPTDGPGLFYLDVGSGQQSLMSRSKLD